MTALFYTRSKHLANTNDAKSLSDVHLHMMWADYQFKPLLESLDRKRAGI